MVTYCFKYGAQITCPYTRCGLKKVVNSFLTKGPPRYRKLLRISSTNTFSEMCSSYFSSTWKITPISFCLKTRSSSCQRRVYLSVWVMVWNIFNVKIWRFFGWNLRSYIWHHSSSEFFWLQLKGVFFGGYLSENFIIISGKIIIIAFHNFRRVIYM